ncbi:MAG: dephospho-CoA kinase [Betaproteobacteria bacterium]|nr:dephospho-CoA kinase [Betaproteobacteria bacterium]
MRRPARRTQARARTIQPGAAAFALSGLRQRDQRAGEHSASLLRAVARPLLGLRRTHRAPLSGGGSARGPRGSLLRFALRLRRRRVRGHVVRLGVDRRQCDRHGHAAPARRRHPAAALDGSAPQYRRNLRRSALGGDRGSRGIPVPVVGILAVQVRHREGRHGLWRFQAARGDRRLDRLADAAAGSAAVLVHRRRGRHCADRPRQTRPRRAHSLWPVPGGSRHRGPFLGPAVDPLLRSKAPVTYIVGLTGGIGSGKSAVAKLFEDKSIAVIDTDAIAHELTRAGGDAIEAIRAEFGDPFIDRGGALDRAGMRRLAFSDPQARQRLERILHPRIRALAAARAAAASSPYVILMVPLLVEGGLIDENNRRRYQRVLVVDCPEEVQIERVARRSGLGAAEVRRIIASQAARSERLAAADDVIDNGGALEALRPQVERLHRRYLALSRPAGAGGD